jgi:hypothetical protein
VPGKGREKFYQQAVVGRQSSVVSAFVTLQNRDGGLPGMMKVNEVGSADH